MTSEASNPTGSPQGPCLVGQRTGYLARYASLVTSADKGAVLKSK